MRKLSFALLLLLAPLCASAQTAPNADSSWLRVVHLSPGAGLHIKTASHTTLRCTFRSATDEAVSCHNAKDIVVQRTEIRSISVSHRGRSTLIGAAIGAGAGGIAGAATGRSGQIVGRGGLAAIFAIPLGVIGGIVGAATDFSHSTVYRAP